MSSPTKSIPQLRSPRPQVTQASTPGVSTVDFSLLTKTSNSSPQNQNSSPISSNIHNSKPPYKIALASTTLHGLQCAQTLFADSEHFQFTFVLTPPPRPIGRKQTLTPNPVELWAQTNHLSIIYVDQKITPEILTQIQVQGPLDFLLIVDFGFYVPTSLLALPRLAPLNIHPSALPKYRGASPGQFVLFSGDPDSAVTLMIPNAKMDQGDILTQYPFPIDFNWTQQDYYAFAFNLICQHLTQDLLKFASGELQPMPQPETSPTPPARQVSKADTFIDFSLLSLVLNPNQIRQLLPWLTTKKETSQLSIPESGGLADTLPLSLLETQILQELSLDQTINSRSKLSFFVQQIQQLLTPNSSNHPKTEILDLITAELDIPAASLDLSRLQAAIVNTTERAIRAFAGWPEVWTLLPATEDKPPLRCKLLKSTLNSTQPPRLNLTQIKVEGKSTQNFD